VRVPLFKDRPSLRPPRGAILRRVLVILAPTEADVRSVRALWRKLRPLGVEVVAGSECHGEVRGERSEFLLPNLLLLDAARQDWDAVIVAGGTGALLVADDQLARQVARRAEAEGKPVAAVGLGRSVLERAGVDGFASADAGVIVRRLREQLGLGSGEPPVDSHAHAPSLSSHDGRAPMRCDEIMKRTVECVTAKDTVQAAARKMRDDNIGFLPVCENGSKVIGTITDRDIAIRACADDRAASKTKIGDVMTREVVGCRPTDDISKAQELMSKHHKSRMLCIDESNKLVGVISLSDIAQHQADAGAKTLRDVTTREAHVQH